MTATITARNWIHEPGERRRPSLFISLAPFHLFLFLPISRRRKQPQGDEPRHDQRDEDEPLRSRGIARHDDARRDRTNRADTRSA